jgi:hypothetical protein
MSCMLPKTDAGGYDVRHKGIGRLAGRNDAASARHAGR